VSELAYVTTHFDLLSSPHFVADFLQRSVIVHGKRSFCVFEPPPPFRGLGATYDIHVSLIGKRIRRVVSYLLVLIELFC